jgi:hypothetical protein
LLFAVVLVGFGIGTSPAAAIPAWARAEGMSCNECHIRANRLNQFGLDYYRRGFRSEVKPIAAHEAISDKYGNYLSLQGVLDWNKRKDQDYSTANKVTAFAGGALGGNYSFLAETTVNPPDSQEVADLFFGWTAGTKERYQFLRVGQMLPLLTVDNPYEVAADRDAVFVRDRRQGVAYGYNFGRFWVEGMALSSAGPTTNNKVDTVVDGQYLFTEKGSSLGVLYWNGYFSPDSTTSDDFRRLAVVGNFNEVENLYLTAGYSDATGDSANGGVADSKGWFAQAEYAFNDKLTVLIHGVDVRPDLGEGSRIYTSSLDYWPHEHIALRLQYILTEPEESASSYSARFRVRIMF